tara:strand:+ start:1295 stop:2011 length:717 start_codon:yes stop_codon:yes gene_type:complete
MYDHWKENSKSIPKQKLIVAKRFLKNFKDFSHKKNLNILDIGCGNGVHLIVLNSLNKRNNLYGVDKSRNLIKFYDEEFKINVKFSFGNCSRLPYSNNSIDMIICYGVLPYIKKPKKVFDEINRVLKSHGEVLIWTPPKPKQKSLFLLKSTQYLSKYAWLGNILANLIVPFLFVIKSDSNINLFNSKWSDCLEIIKVNTMEKTYFYNKNYYDNLLKNYKSLKKLKIKYYKDISYYLRKI